MLGLEHAHGGDVSHLLGGVGATGVEGHLDWRARLGGGRFDGGVAS